MEKQYIVEAEQLCKVFHLYKNQNEKVRDFLRIRKTPKEFYALQDVSFQVERGESVGLVGVNGSGKSTLANLLGGLSEPSAGMLTVIGEPALISIGAGLHPHMTGIENIEYKGLLMGLTKEQILSIQEDVINFSELGAFINQPVKTYSSGMKSRLGFSIAVNINPEILIVDEALSVGDPTFAQKCLERMNTFRKQGKTVFFVSHNLVQMRSFCDRIIWLDHGHQMADGPSEDVLPIYEHFLKTRAAKS